MRLIPSSATFIPAMKATPILFPTTFIIDHTWDENEPTTCPRRENRCPISYITSPISPPALLNTRSNASSPDVTKLKTIRTTFPKVIWPFSAFDVFPDS